MLWLPATPVDGSTKWAVQCAGHMLVHDNDDVQDTCYFMMMMM